jgi:hypothetical protein
VAGSESITTKASANGHTLVTTKAQTTASNNIATKVGNLNEKKSKEKGPKEKQKETAPNDPENLNLSDEDDSREREAALSSPIKGKTSRELNKANFLSLYY